MKCKDGGNGALRMRCNNFCGSLFKFFPRIIKIELSIVKNCRSKT